MTWVPPANRSNQYITRWHRTLKATDTRFYQRHTRVTIPKQPAQYSIGQRVIVNPVSAYVDQERQHGRIVAIHYYGHQYPQYTIKLDSETNKHKHTTVAGHVLECVSLMVVEPQPTNIIPINFIQEVKAA